LNVDTIFKKFQFTSVAYRQRDNEMTPYLRTFEDH